MASNLLPAKPDPAPIPVISPSKDPGKRKYDLESPEAQLRLGDLLNWRRSARLAQADNRTEQAIDEDFYDSIQFEDADIQAFRDRNQPPSTFNVIKNSINWLLGTELKARIDWRVLPRKKADSQTAKTKTKLLKYVQDVSRGEFVRSEAFADCIKAGVGWIEIGARQNGDEPIYIRNERWRNVWFDHLGLEPDCSDWRFVFREKWIDLDIVQAMFPEREHDLKLLAEAANSLYPYLPEDIDVSDKASEFDLDQQLEAIFGGSVYACRERLRITEMWYRMPSQVKLLRMRDQDTPYGALDGTIYRPESEEHNYLVKGRYFTLFDAYQMVTRLAIFAARIFLQDVLTPYNHNRFPLIPMFCYRRRRDNMPYGVIRDLRDPQTDLNKRRSKSLFLLSANQYMYEDGAINDPAKFYQEANKPDGLMKVNNGAMSQNRVQRQEHIPLAEAHLKLAEGDENFIHSILGVTYENEGKTKKDLSGIAISKLQSQGQTSSGVPFNSYYFAFQSAGETLLSLIEQFYDQQKEILITGDQHKDEFVTINEFTEDGRIENDITRAKARFIVGKQDFRESIRIAMFEMLSQLVQALAQSMPEVALALLDEVVDFMDDLPNKDEMVQRIRKINRQHAPDDEMTPEQKQQVKQVEEQAAQEQNVAKQMQMALAQAQLAVTQAEAAGKMTKAMRDQTEAQMKKLEGFIKALEAAGVIQSAPQLVGAADQLILESEKAGSNGGGNQRQLGQREQLQ